MNEDRPIYNRASGRFFAICRSLILVGLAIILACGRPASAADSTSPANNTPPQIEPARLIEVLKARRQLPDNDFLISLLSHPDPRSRWLAVRDLGETGKTEFITLLVPLLDDSNPEVRRQTRLALMGLCYDREGLYATYQKAAAGLSPSGRLTAQAIWDDAKGRGRAEQYYRLAFNTDPKRFWAGFLAMPPNQLIPRIGNALNKEIARIEPRIDEFMAQPDNQAPLTELRDAFALAVFAEAVDREIARVAFTSGDLSDAAKLRQQAAEALSGIRRVAEKAKNVEIKLGQQGQRFMPSDFDPGLAESASLAQARALAAHELGEVNSPEASTALIEALETDPNPLARVRAADSLGRLCPSDIQGTLIRSVKEDPNADVRRAALVALGCRETEESRRVVREYAKDPEYLDAVILASANLGTDEDMAFLFEQAERILAGSPDDRIPSLSEPGDEPAMEALITALKIIAPKRPDADQPAIQKYLESLSQR